MANDMIAGKESYFQLNRGKVCYSQQIDENVIADYDAMGAVVGLEFLDPKAAEQREKFLALANQKTMGAVKVGKPPTADEAA
jgi:hypothetical protein